MAPVVIGAAALDGEVAEILGAAGGLVVLGLRAFQALAEDVVGLQGEAVRHALFDRGLQAVIGGVDDSDLRNRSCPGCPAGTGAGCGRLAVVARGVPDGVVAVHGERQVMRQRRRRRPR